MRIILIDAHSGYIWGDSADLGGRIFQTDVLPMWDEEAHALAFAEALDSSLGETGRTYEAESWHVGRSGATGYYAYRADVNGSDAVTIVTDGQDPEMIEAVERDCQPICFVQVLEGEG